MKFKLFAHKGPEPEVAEIERLRAEKREAAAADQAEINRLVGERAVNGVIKPGEYRQIKQEVTGETPVVSIDPPAQSPETLPPSPSVTPPITKPPLR